MTATERSIGSDNPADAWVTGEIVLIDGLFSDAIQFPGYFPCGRSG